MTLWTALEAAQATGGQALGDWHVNGVSIDTRTITPGDFFVALKDVRDGHDFVAQALEKGAAAAMVSHRPEGVPKDAPLLIVKDVLAALEALGVAARARTKARVVGITGSVGKTSTKEMLRDVLAEQGRTHAAEASYNNHWGVPLTLARMPKDTEFAVIEIGMNHPGEIAPLARMARPHVALITTVAAAHLEAFEGIAGIAHEKAAIFDGLEPGGVAIINVDLETTPVLIEKAQEHAAKVLTYGKSSADYTLMDVVPGDGLTVVKASLRGTPALFRIMSTGAHFAMNGLGALAAVEALGGDSALAAIALGRWHPGRGRGASEVIALDRADVSLSLRLYDDSYNANPTSVGAALEMLAASPEGRRVVYLGDMKELGADEADLHRALAKHPAMATVDRVHTIGPLMRLMWQALPEEKRGRYCATSEEMAIGIHHDLRPGDVVLVKGSLSMGLARVVDALRKMGQVTPKQEGIE
jgi:UDP-N-acetylmuramoyl-tripeptide--D-alanyl-D-alanine ligase